MKLLLPYFIILLVILQLALRKNTRKENDKLKQFLDREAKANTTRKKDISNLDYITIPDTLPFIKTNNIEIIRNQDTIRSLMDKKIVNLSDMSNTDLKLKYGVGNLQALSEYDENYTILMRSVNSLGTLLLDNGFEKEGVEFLEFGISCITDISQNYIVLAKYYAEHGMKDKIDGLIICAGNSSSPLKNSTIKSLNEIKSH